MKHHEGAIGLLVQSTFETILRKTQVRRPRIVMIYNEPTPYISALVNVLQGIWAGSIEVQYRTTDRSQRWNLKLDREREKVLPIHFFSAIQVISETLITERQQTVLHLAGWGHPILFGAMVVQIAFFREAHDKPVIWYATE
jgi:hypothetical protein